MENIKKPGKRRAIKATATFPAAHAAQLIILSKNPDQYFRFLKDQIVAFSEQDIPLPKDYDPLYTLTFLTEHLALPILSGEDKLQERLTKMLGDQLFFEIGSVELMRSMAHMLAATASTLEKNDWLENYWTEQREGFKMMAVLLDACMTYDATIRLDNCRKNK